MVNCPDCGSEKVHRSRRRSLADNVKANFGFWPYRCLRCQARFSAGARRNVPAPAGEAWSNSRKTQNEEAAMAFRTHTSTPVAKVLITAQSEEQLNHILLALESAVSSYDHASKEHSSEFAGSR